jgi:hypothetical protein
MRTDFNHHAPNMELRSFGDDLLREFERGKRCEQCDVCNDTVANHCAREWTDFLAGRFAFVPARRRLERELDPCFFGKFGKSDYI